MAMSEKEVQELETRILADTTIEPEFEYTWLKNELRSAQEAEKKIILAFRLHKHNRNDVAMQQNETGIKEVRTSIMYLKEQLEKLRSEHPELDGNPVPLKAVVQKVG